MERRGNHRRESNAGPHSSAAVNSAEVFRVQLYGISEGEKCDDDIRASREFEV